MPSLLACTPILEEVPRKFSARFSQLIAEFCFSKINKILIAHLVKSMNHEKFKKTKADGCT